MRKIVSLSVVVVIACMMIAVYTCNLTTFANEEAGHMCMQCEKPADSHGGAIIVEHDGAYLAFCCPDCISKHKKERPDESHRDDKLHDPDEQKGYEKY